MREIKFRGKRENGIWVVGCYAISKIPLMQVEHIIIENGFKPNVVDPETVGQYTGLHDRNGVEIYEGDIVVSFKKEYEHTPTTNDVRFVRGCWRLVAGPMNDVPLYNYTESELDVIGNIYETKEG